MDWDRDTKMKMDFELDTDMNIGIDNDIDIGTVTDMDYGNRLFGGPIASLQYTVSLVQWVNSLLFA
jgi:hypothetical protein